MYWFCLCLLYLCMWCVSTFLFLFLKTSKLKVISFPQQKTRKKNLFFFVSFCFTYLSFFLFLMPCFHKAASCSLGMQEAKLVWMNCLLFSFFIITKFLCGFNSFSAISSFLFRVFFYMMLSCCDFCAIPYFRFQIWEMGGCMCVSKNVRFFLFF